MTPAASTLTRISPERGFGSGPRVTTITSGEPKDGRSMKRISLGSGIKVSCQHETTDLGHDLCLRKGPVDVAGHFVSPKDEKTRPPSLSLAVALTDAISTLMRPISSRSRPLGSSRTPIEQRNSGKSRSRPERS
ncbi:hypothetical protein D3C87_1776700 [compost metagenome]